MARVVLATRKPHGSHDQIQKRDAHARAIPIGRKMFHHDLDIVNHVLDTNNGGFLLGFPRHAAATGLGSFSLLIDRLMNHSGGLGDLILT